MDVRAGWILEALREEGMAENTIIVFFGDNGRLTARGIHWVWDAGIHVPMIVRWPDRFPTPPRYSPGGVYDGVVSLLDLTATTLWIADTGDRGVYPESEYVVAPFEQEMHDWFGTPDWYLEAQRGAAK